MKKVSECLQKKQWEKIVEKWKQQQQNDKNKRYRDTAIQNANGKGKIKMGPNAT